MAEQLKFVDASNTTLLDLNSTSGVQFMASSMPARAENIDWPVIDTYPCKVIGSSDDNLASQLNSLNRILDRATRYDLDSTEENEVWLTDQLAAETNGRRTLVLGGSWKYDVNPHTVPTRDKHTALITLAVKHMPGYEGTASTSVSASNVSVFGGSVVLTTLATGDMPARAQFFYTGNTGTIETLWLGMRSWSKHPDSSNSGTLTNFVPLWEAELGTLGTNTATSSTYDASSTGSTPKAVLVSFADANWAERVRILASTVSASYPEAQAGRFLVLGRMRLDTGTDTVQVRLRSGWYSSAMTPQYKTLDPVTISGTNFQYYELGTVKFPPIFGAALGFTAASNYGATGMTNAALSLIAARTSGSTSKLVIDHFAMVPIDEGFAKISGLALSPSILAYISETPKDTPLSAAFGTSFSSSPAISQNRFFVPVGACNMYVFGQRSGVSTIGDTVDINAGSPKRFYSLRGTA